MAKLTSLNVGRIVRVLLCLIAAHILGISAFADTQAKRIRVDGKTQRTKLIHEVPAEYPQDAKDHHIEGVVHLKVTIGTDGTMKELEAISGHPLLVKAALQAVRQWRYQPTEVNGEPVEVVTAIAVVFKLP
jgi:protein TonB